MAAAATLGTLLLALSGGPVRADSAVTSWNGQALQAIRDTHPGPPIVARMLTIVNTCMYDAWACYDSTATGPTDHALSLNTMRRPAGERTPANKEKAVSYAAYRALVDLFPQPAQVAMFRAAMIAGGYDPDDASTNTATPQGIGNVIAQTVLAFRHADGSNQLGDLHPGAYTDYSGYVPVNDSTHINDPNRWQPLRPAGAAADQKFIAPFWENVLPYALTSPAQFDAQVPPPVTTTSDFAAYRLQALQVLQYSAHLTDRQKVAAEYWADGPNSELPPGHWILFAQFVSHRDGYAIGDDAKMFFAMTNAILDASVLSWHLKRKYDYVRPVTAIRYLFAGRQVPAWGGPYQGTRRIDGANWKPYQAASIVTPPFPEYISGHSVFSRSAADTLALYTGSDVFNASVTIPAGSSVVEPGAVPAAPVTLSWATFTAAADEAGISRRYGGIHFVAGDVYSRQVARLIATQAWAKTLTYFNGTGAP